MRASLIRESRLLPPKAGRLASRSAKPTLDGSSLNRQDKLLCTRADPTAEHTDKRKIQQGFNNNSKTKAKDPRRNTTWIFTASESFV